MEEKMLHTAQLICQEDKSVSSDIMEAPTVAAAKASAKANYQTKYNANKNWQKKWTTFSTLLAVSSYKTS